MLSENCSCKFCVQSWPQKCVLGCVISRLRQQAESRNLGQPFLANSVHVLGFKFTADLRTFSYLATVPEVPVNHCRQSESPLKGSNIWKCLSPYYLIDRNCTVLFIHSVAKFCYGCRQKLRGSAWGDQ